MNLLLFDNFASYWVRVENIQKLYGRLYEKNRFGVLICMPSLSKAEMIKNLSVEGRRVVGYY